MSLYTVLPRILQIIRYRLKFFRRDSPWLLYSWASWASSFRAKFQRMRQTPSSSSRKIAMDGGEYYLTHKHDIDEATRFKVRMEMGRERDEETKAIVIRPSRAPVESSHLSYEVEEPSLDPAPAPMNSYSVTDLRIKPGEPASSFTYSHQQTLLPSLPTAVDVDLLGQDAASSSPEPIRTQIGNIHNTDPTPMLAVGLSEVHPLFSPRAPERLLRYDRGCSVKKEQTQLPIEPLRCSYKAAEPDGWSSFLHPEGARYFYDAKRRIYTDANMNDRGVLSLVTYTINTLDDYIRSNHITLDSDVDVVLDFANYGDGPYSCYYYLACHRNRSIFWLDPYDAENLDACYEVLGVTSLSHLGHEIEAQYWYHCSFFPNCRKVALEEIRELRDILTWALCDQITSGTSTTPYRPPELQQMIEITDGLRESEGTPQTTCTFGRLMTIFMRQKFYNFHGEPAARLNRDQSVYENAESNHRTPLITILGPLLFFAPDTHLETLRGLWIDGLISNAHWIKSVDKLTNQWQSFMLYATVLLNANVAFLAIQSVDQSTVYPTRSAAQLTSYVSVVTSIGAIILGLMLIRQHGSDSRTWQNAAAGAGVKFLAEKTHHPKLRLETLAILYSLPYGLLMWSMVSFLAAFSIMTFDHSALSVGLVMCSAWLVISVLVIWCMIVAWDKRQENNFLAAWTQKIGSDFSRVASRIFHRRDDEREERSKSTYTRWKGIFSKGSTRDSQAATA